jgi:hypothetical protein
VQKHTRRSLILDRRESDSVHNMIGEEAQDGSFTLSGVTHDTCTDTLGQ